MLYTVLLFLIILLTVAIYAENIKKSEHFEQKKCLGKVSSKMNNGKHGYYSNFMLNTFSNFDTVFGFLKDKSVKALNALNQYKVDLEQAYEIDNNTRQNLIATTDNVDQVSTTVRNMINNKITSYDNEKTSTEAKFQRIDSNANSLTTIDQNEVINKVTGVVNRKAKSQFQRRVTGAVNSNKFQAPFQNIIAQKVSTKAFNNTKDVNPYNWQCEPNIIGAPIRINSETGRIECLSTNGANCDTNFCRNNDPRDVDFTNMKTVECTDKQATTPNESPNGWCNKAFRTLYNEDTTDYKGCPKDWKMLDRARGVCMAPSNYLGNSRHDSASGSISPECKAPNVNCQVLSQFDTPKKIREWSQSTNTLFPHKVNVIQRGRDISNVLAQVDNVLKNTLGTGTPPSRIEKYNVYKNGVIVKAYNLKERNGEAIKGKLIYDNIVSSNINFRENDGGTFLSIRPPYSDPNANFNTNKIFAVLTGFIKIPVGTNVLKLKLTYDDGIRLMVRQINDRNWNTLINNFNTNGQKESITAPFGVTSESFIEYLIEYRENEGAVRLVLEWDTKNNNRFDIIPREALFIDRDECSKSINLKKKQNWECLDNRIVRLNDNGDAECLSIDGRNCITQNNPTQCQENIDKFADHSRLDPLICGQMHQSLFGDSGYTNPNHWCSKTRTNFDPSNQQTLTEESFGGRCGRIQNRDVKCLPGRCCNKYGFCGDQKFCAYDNTNAAFSG